MHAKGQNPLYKSRNNRTDERIARRTAASFASGGVGGVVVAVDDVLAAAQTKV